MAGKDWQIKKIRHYGTSYVVCIPSAFVKALHLKSIEEVIIHLAQGGLYIQPLRIDNHKVPMNLKNLVGLPE